jgi:hypothetical protein
MPVTITPATHGANIIQTKGYPVKTPQDILNRACPEEGANCVELLQSSFDSNFNPVIQPSANGFVHGVILAYNQHHHLQIRPEDGKHPFLNQHSPFISRQRPEIYIWVIRESSPALEICVSLASCYPSQGSSILALCLPITSDLWT